MSGEKKKLSKEELEYFKKIILEKREEVINNIRKLEEVTISGSSGENGAYSDSTYAYHMADVGTDAQEREKAFLWLSRENKFLKHLDAALQRIEAGEYGFCIECGKRIPKERLEEVPHTQHCVECKNRAR